VPLTLNPFNPDFLKSLKVFPREVKSLEGANEKSAWVFKTSVFKLYREDNKDLLDKCFLDDWQYIELKIAYVIKDEGERSIVKSILKSNYRLLRSAYKYTAG
jgi:hypothetical protein